MQNIVKHFHCVSCGINMLIFAEEKFYAPIWKSRYAKILKSYDYFENINIDVLIPNTLQRTSCLFYTCISTEANFYLPIWESRCDKILKNHDYFQNTDLNVVFILNTSVVPVRSHGLRRWRIFFYHRLYETSLLILIYENKDV